MCLLMFQETFFISFLLFFLRIFPSMWAGPGWPGEGRMSLRVCALAPGESHQVVTLRSSVVCGVQGIGPSRRPLREQLPLVLLIMNCRKKKQVQNSRAQWKNLGGAFPVGDSNRDAVQGWDLLV